MNQLPCELLHQIFGYIDQPLDLFRISCVCSRWRSLIMNNEYFLNQWFSQSLERSRQTVHHIDTNNSYQSKQKSMLNIDQLLFPISLRSSECWFPPTTVLVPSFHDEDQLVYFYPLSLLKSSHSFSFWLFLPYRRDLVIQVSNFNFNGQRIVLCANEHNFFENRPYVSIDDRWIHVVLNKIDLQSNYRIFIDGQYVSQCNPDISFIDMDVSSFLYNMGLFDNFDHKSSRSYNTVRIADFNAFKRCLTHLEIEAIHQQQTSITQVKVGTYINSNKIHNIKVD